MTTIYMHKRDLISSKMAIKWITLYCLAFLDFSLYAFDNQFNKTDAHAPIKRFFLMGERCSGTKFVTNLIDDNLLMENELVYHKHYIPWLDVEEHQKINEYQLTKEEAFRFFTNTEDVLFIFVVRDPYDWVRSFFQNPYHVKKHLLQNFHSFISQEWECKCKDVFYPFISFFKLVKSFVPLSLQSAVLYYGAWEIDNYNPWSSNRFANIFELRKYRNINFLNISKYVKNYLFVRYEDVRDDQKGFIEFISSFYKVSKKDSFIPKNKYVGLVYEKKAFKKSTYFVPTHEEIEYINASIDWDVENLLGYLEKSVTDLEKESLK